MLKSKLLYILSVSYVAGLILGFKFLYPAQNITDVIEVLSVLGILMGIITMLVINFIKKKRSSE